VRFPLLLSEVTRPMADAIPDTSGKDPPESSDQSLLRKFTTGDQQAATTFYHRYAARLHALVKAQCSSELARILEPEELVQSVFGTFFEKASQGYYTVPDGKDLWGLLLVIILNKIRSKKAFYNAAKRDNRKTMVTEDLDKILQSKESNEVAGRFLHLVINEAMQSLPPAHMAMMQLRLEGYEVAEIAEKTERSKRTVERVLQDFRTKLTAVLQHDSE
jgi:RNA polymerase sigma-70 factor, ECF subfamily